jgi:hypothetical protein
MTTNVLVTWFVLLGGMASLSAYGQSPDPRDQEYALGVALAKCLPEKCKLIGGTLLTDNPKRGTFVEIVIKPSLVSGGPPETLDVRYSSPGLPASADPRLSAVWKGVSFTRGSAVTAVVAKEQVGDCMPGGAVLVTTNERESRTIHALFSEEAKLTRSGGEIERAVNSLSIEPSAALAGYLFEYLTRREITKNPDLGVRLLAHLVQNPSVPATAWSRIFLFLALDYHMASANQKLELGSELAKFARDADPRLAACAIQAIARIASADEEFGARVSSGAIEGLEVRYQALVLEGRISRDAALEGRLGIRRP